MAPVVPPAAAATRKRSQQQQQEKDDVGRQHSVPRLSVVPGKRRRSSAATLGEQELTVEEQNRPLGEQKLTVSELEPTVGDRMWTAGEPKQTAGEPKQTGSEPSGAGGEPCVTVGEQRPTVGEQKPTVGEQKHAVDEDHLCLPDGAPQNELFLVSIKTIEDLDESVDVAAEVKAVDLVLQQLQEQKRTTIDDVDVAWGHEFAALDSLRRFAKHHQEQARRQLKNDVLVKFVLPAALSLRSIMARNALLCVQELILGLKVEATAHFSVVVPVLLNRACSKKQFLRDLARDVLDTALRAGADEAFLHPLMSTATTEKNAQIVGVAGVYMTKCVVRMDRAHLRTFVLETRSSFFDEMASFLNCKAVECKTATRRSCQHTRRVIGDETFVTRAKEKLRGIALSDVLRASETRKAAEPGHAKLSIRERVLQMKKQQQQQRQRSEGNDVSDPVAASLYDKSS
ncbi:unnamed protein product [Hyaloperonospora brassicae]|uniref:TOG domain-containing protein n=1 Tax=Hyaloperonospora brassicae TaxID=162125 RepID=A0AAV0UZK5_HYABA|nr:unnamed protein product [Hyaloperonospora brassicae]